MLNHKLLGSVSSLPSDANFENVSLLLSGDGTNGAQNNTFLDSSTNNFTITRNGNTTQGSFSPYGSNWGNYFGGTGNYLTGSTPLFGTTTSTFTIEGFLYPTAYDSTSGENIVIADCSPTGSTFNIGCWVNNSGQMVLNWWTGSAGVQSISTSTIPLNQWSYFAIVVNSNAISMYINSTTPSALTGTSTLTNRGSAAQNFTVGQYASDFRAARWVGYMSNIRVSTVARSITDIPSAPLSSDANTKVLTCQSNRFIDTSPNAYTITRFGTPSVQHFSPFNPTAPYSTSVIGGSGYFDGSDDYLNLSTQAILNVGTGNFTFECFIYFPTVSSPLSRAMIFGPDEATFATGIQIRLQGATQGATGFEIVINNSIVITYTTAIAPNMWNHIALVRQGTGTNQVKLYVNGINVASGTSTASLGSSNYNIGSLQASSPEYSDFYTGYISNLRVVKSAVYTSAFTPPTAPVTAITNTSLLTNFTNAGIPDLAMQNNLETVGNAQVSTSVKKYGTGSLAFDGTGDYLLAPNSPLFEFGTGNFTIEAWVWIDSTVNPGRPDNNKSVTIFSTGSSSSDDCAFSIIGNTSVAGTGFELYQVSPGIAITVSATVGTNSWAHIAFVRTGTTIYVFVNGTRYTLGTTSVAIGSSVSPKIGIANSSGYTNQFKGYIDDLRITKGVARYTANFTPPASALPTF